MSLKWDKERIEEWMKPRYPSGMRVFYDIDELENAIRSGEVKGAVGIPYHIIIGSPAVIGMQSSRKPRYDNERRLKALSSRHVEIIVLTAIHSWSEQTKEWM